MAFFTQDIRLFSDSKNFLLHTANNRMEQGRFFEDISIADCSMSVYTRTQDVTKPGDMFPETLVTGYSCSLDISFYAGNTILTSDPETIQKIKDPFRTISLSSVLAKVYAKMKERNPSQ